jgi:ribonuclease HI
MGTDRADTPSRAEICAALARELDIAAVGRRFGLSREDLSRLFQEAAALFEKADAGAWRLFVDGASRGNPGPAGAGAVLFDPAGHPKGEVSQYLGETTNNVAEYQALLHGLKLALELGVKDLQIMADSLLIVQQLKGAYQVKTPHLYPLFSQARQTLQEFNPCALSHLDRSLNHEADRLARQAIDRHLGKK